jgi:putative endonuclease
MESLPGVSGGASICADARPALGRAGEAAAVDYLRRRLYSIFTVNFRTRYGEIDIIARRGPIVAFVEVKTRRGKSFGEPFEAVGPRKQQQLRRMASLWLSLNRADMSLRECSFRFDVISVLVDGRGKVSEISHMKDAFR